MIQPAPTSYAVSSNRAGTPPRRRPPRTRSLAVRLCSSTIVLVFAAAGCTRPADESASRDSLYSRLGGEAAISAVVDDFVARGAANPAVHFSREGTERHWAGTPEQVARLKRGLVLFICQATGGPQKYEGRDMRTLHAGMNITGAEFDALADDLRASLDKLNVPARERDELMAVVATTRTDIVEIGGTGKRPGD